MNVSLREANAEDARVCGTICYEAFHSICERHGFPPDFPNAEMPTGLFEHLIARRLMEDVLKRAAAGGFAGVRLVQTPFNNLTMALYSKLGFDVQEPLSVMHGPALKSKIPGYEVRAATMDDLEACDALCQKIHGHDRHGDLADAIGQGTATVVERDGRISGYATSVGFPGHAIGETNEDLKALICAAEEFSGPGFHIPSRNADLMR